MSPLFLVNWHRMHVRFRALMWLIAAALAVVILVNSAPARGPQPATVSHSAAPHGPVHLVSGQVTPGQ